MFILKSGGFPLTACTQWKWFTVVLLQCKQCMLPFLLSCNVCHPTIIIWLEDRNLSFWIWPLVQLPPLLSFLRLNVCTILYKRAVTFGEKYHFEYQIMCYFYFAKWLFSPALYWTIGLYIFKDRIHKASIVLWLGTFSSISCCAIKHFWVVSQICSDILPQVTSSLIPCLLFCSAVVCTDSH